MSLSRRAFLKSSAAIDVASGGLKLFGLKTRDEVRVVRLHY